MTYFTQYFTPAFLTGYVRDALADLDVNQFGLRRFLPSRYVPDLEFRFQRGTGGLRKIGQYRAYDAEAPIGKRKGLQGITGELPPLSAKILLGEYDRLRMLANGDEQVKEIILNDAVEQALLLETRAEKARADALVNGIVVISENGVEATIDYARNPANQVVPATLWSNTVTSDPLNDIQTWVRAYVARNGTRPGVAVTSDRIMGLLQQNAVMRAMFGNILGAPTLLSPAQVNSVLQSFNLPQIELFDAQYEDAAGAAQRFIPDTDFILLPAPVGVTDWQSTKLGATFWGNTSESLEPEFNLVGTGEEPGIVAAQYKEIEPVAIWTKASGISVPALANPDLSFRARVL